MFSQIPYRYKVLAVLSVLSAVAAYAGRGYWMVDAFAANVAAGFMGALLTVVLVDRAAERRQEEMRQRVQRMAMSQVRRPLTHIAHLLVDMMKAAMFTRPVPPPATFREFFSRPHTDCLDWLMLEGRSGSLGNVNWYDHIHETLERSSKRLSEIVDKYMAYLGIEFVEAVEDLREDGFMALLGCLGETRRRLANENLPLSIALNGTAPIRDEFFRKLLRLIEEYESASVKTLPFPSVEFSRDDISPELGSSRLVQLPQAVTVADGPPPIVTDRKRV